MTKVYLYNFLPIYPDYNSDVKDILGDKFIEEGDPNYNIYRKKEFYDYKLEEKEPKPSIGKYMNHQVIISRFLSSNTQYKGLLLMHEPGTGKTCSSVATVERIRRESNEYKRALIIMKGQNLINNYINELAFVCTCKEKDDKGNCIEGPYIPIGSENLSEEKRKRRINSLINKYYEFQTFQKFTDYIEKTSDNTLIKEFSNRIIVIDEAHNLRLSDKKEIGQYENMHRFLHIVKSCKVILLTGTPMVDRPNEIAGIMNLILPLNRQIPTLDNFTKNFLIVDQKDKDLTIMNPKSVKKLKSYLHGYVSYLVAMKSDVKKTFVGDLNIGNFKLYPITMKPQQQKEYMRAYLEDQKGKTGVYNESIQSCLFVFPNGSYGSEGFKEYIKSEEQKVSIYDKDKRKTKMIYKALPSFKKIFGDAKTNEEKLEKLSYYSSKYSECIKMLLKDDGETHFVYIKLVEGSGAVVFSKLLEEFGFKDTKGGEGQGLKYSIITNATTTENETVNILKTFNGKGNMNGNYIKVIIGSEKMAEGITLKNVRNIHIVTPSWNFSEIDQAIARGYRLFSHSNLIDAGIDVNVKIYLYCNLPSNKSTKESIDYKMYKISQSKDISIKSVERVIKEASMDCALNRDRNTIDPEYSNKRECYYGSCDYKCDGVDDIDLNKDEIDETTYDIYYNDEYVDSIIDRILNIMKNKKVTFITLEEIRNEINNITDVTLTKVLLKMKNSNINFFNKFGNRVFIRYDNNMLYFTYNLKNNSDFLDTYYVNHFPLQQISKIEDETKMLNVLPNLLSKIKKEQETNIKIEYLNEFSLNIQELMLEMSILSSKLGNKMTIDNKSFRDFIINHFKSFVITIDNLTVSTLLEKFRCLHKSENEWRDCDKKETEMVLNYLDEKNREKVAEREKWGYYGIRDTDGKFKISDIKYEQKTKTKIGKRCSSWNIVELLNLIHNIKFHPKEDSYYKKLNGMSSNKLSEYYRENIDGFKDVEKAFGDRFDSFTKEEKIRIMYWGRSKTEGSMNKTIICNALEKWFITNNLFEIEIKEKDKVLKEKDKKSKVKIGKNKVKIGKNKEKDVEVEDVEDKFDSDVEE